MPEKAPDAQIAIAHLVSRVEATVVSSLLRANGVPNVIIGDAHASVEVNSWVLGGHRIMISARDHDETSEILRHAWLEGMDEPSYAQGKAVLRVFLILTALKLPFLAIVAIFGPLSFGWFIALLVQGLPIPVNPQGRGDYYLAAPSVS
ncbi:MAG: hypothetical protein AAF127_05590 [Pseudomonadota bacterium]